MIKTIITLFAIYNSVSSSSRMLHQWAPPANPGLGAPPANPGAPPPAGGVGVGPQAPPAQPQFPAAPAPPQFPAAPAPPQFPAAPAPPINPGIGAPGIGAPGIGAPGLGGIPANPATPSNPVAGGAPWDPATGNAAPGTGVGGAWIPPAIPSLQAAQQATVKECNLPNTAVAGCAGRATTVTNPGRNYKMTCANIGACAAADINFNFQNSYVERVEMMSFSEMYAGYGATVTIDSTQSMRKQYIDKFECKAYGACMNTNVRLVGGASLNDVDCPYPSYCQGCTIEVCERGPMGGMLCGTPKPCFGY